MQIETSISLVTSRVVKTTREESREGKELESLIMEIEEFVVL